MIKKTIYSLFMGILFAFGFNFTFGSEIVVQRNIGKYIKDFEVDGINLYVVENNNLYKRQLNDSNKYSIGDKIVNNIEYGIKYYGGKVYYINKITGNIDNIDISNLSINVEINKRIERFQLVDGVIVYYDGTSLFKKTIGSYSNGVEITNTNSINDFIYNGNYLLILKKEGWYKNVNGINTFVGDFTNYKMNSDKNSLIYEKNGNLVRIDLSNCSKSTTTTLFNDVYILYFFGNNILYMNGYDGQVYNKNIYQSGLGGVIENSRVYDIKVYNSSFYYFDSSMKKWNLSKVNF